jgi:hypothetical protein
MTNKNKTLELLNYINTPMGKENIMLLYNANNIRYEKCELFNDFVQSLITLIFNTYMGDEFTNNFQQKNHFKWCWDKNIDNFKKEGIKMGDIKTFNYFMEFMFDVYYPLNKKEENPTIHSNILRLWNYIFDYNNIKSKSDIDTLIEIYKLLENTLSVEK